MFSLKMLHRSVIFTSASRIQRFFASQTVPKNNNVTGSHQYTEKEQERILSVINNILEPPSRLHITKRHLKSIKTYLEENQYFKSLDEICALEGLGQRSFNKICKSILNEENVDSETPHLVLKPPSNYTIPLLSESQKKGINSVVAVQIGNFAISWCRLDSINQRVTHWETEDYLNLSDSKNINCVFEFVANLRKSIPVGDLYVFENVNWSILSTQTSLLYHVRAAQTTAMLMALLQNGVCVNYSKPFDKEFNREEGGCVYFLKTYLPTRYFKTLIGSERVSPQKMVEEMLEGKFPDFCTNVSFEETSKNYYLHQDKSLKEALCQSLLLSITFMDIVLYDKVMNSK